MKPGPKPTPTPLRLLKGGRVAEDSKEPTPQVPDELPDPPAWLDNYAQEEWRRVMPDLWATGVYASIDEQMLCGYCKAYSRWRRAEEDLAKMADLDPVTHGAMLKTDKGNAIQNPLVGVASTSLKLMYSIAAEFGFTPSARTRLQGAQRDPGNPAASKYGLE